MYICDWKVLQKSCQLDTKKNNIFDKFKQTVTEPRQNTVSNPRMIFCMQVLCQFHYVHRFGFSGNSQCSGIIQNYSGAQRFDLIHIRDKKFNFVNFKFDFDYNF
jgi:hypothetical protein